MDKKNVLILCGGGGSEHEISLVSAKYLEDSLLSLNKYNVIYLEMAKDASLKDKEGRRYEFHYDGSLNGKTKIDYVFPCIHGTPGETGDIQSFLEILNLPYFGSGPEASKICFNKITTKLWFDAIGIPNTPFTFVDRVDENIVNEFYKKNGSIFLKPSSQGSSVGCHKLSKIPSNLADLLEEGLSLSPYVLIEKALKVRELEVSVYTYKGEICVTAPGEILPPQNDDSFYTFEEKYEKDSHTTTDVVAKNLDKETVETIKKYALEVFEKLKLKDLARVDFFLTQENQIYLNEINTFPGLTPISMFPKMLENQGPTFKEFLDDSIKETLKI